jgi:hypothetical protein
MPRPSANHGRSTPQAPSQQSGQTLEEPLIRQPQLASADELAGRPVPAVLDSGDPAFQPVSPVMRPIAGDTPEPMMRPL